MTVKDLRNTAVASVGAPSFAISAKDSHLAVSVELNEIFDPKIKEGTERVIRDCIGNRPKGEDWKVWIRAASGHCHVVVKGPSYTRSRFFFDDSHTLPEKIRDWLESYPLR